jgi:hypothetical protein
MWKEFRDWYFSEAVTNEAALAYVTVMVLGYTAVIFTYIPRLYMYTGAAFIATLLFDIKYVMYLRGKPFFPLGFPLAILGLYAGLMHRVFGITFFCIKQCT